MVDTLFPIESVALAITRASVEFPSTSFRLESQALGGPIAALDERRCTLAIIVGEDFRNPRLALEAIGSIAQIAVVRSDHPLAELGSSVPIGVPDLAGHLQIVLADPTPLSEGRSFGVLSPFTCRVNTQEAKVALIRAGLGWGRLPAWLVEEGLASGRLARVAIPDLGRNSEVQSEAYLAHRLDEPLGPVAQAFRRALLEQASI